LILKEAKDFEVALPAHDYTCAGACVSGDLVEVASKGDNGGIPNCGVAMYFFSLILECTGNFSSLAYETFGALRHFPLRPSSFNPQETWIGLDLARF
jgi:hypothetical protein